MKDSVPNFLSGYIVIFEYFKDIILGIFGGMIAYMYEYSKKKKNGLDVPWSTASLFLNMLLGGFVSYIFGKFIGPDVTGRDGIIGLIGVTSYTILDVIENNFTGFILKKYLGINKEESFKKEKKKEK